MIPGGYDAFQETLKSIALKKERKDSPASVPTPPPTTASTDGGTPGLTKNGKKRKSVTWAPEGLLESVKLIERAIYDDDVDVSSLLFLARCVLYIDLACFSFSCCLSIIQGVHVNTRDLDKGEGAALHAHLFEEVLDWTEPLRKHIIIKLYPVKSLLPEKLMVAHLPCFFRVFQLSNCRQSQKTVHPVSSGARTAKRSGRKKSASKRRWEQSTHQSPRSQNHPPSPFRCCPKRRRTRT